MGGFSIWHWLIVLAIVVLVFGTKKLRNLGGDLGEAIKNFKGSMKTGDAEATKSTQEFLADDKTSPPPTTTSESKDSHKV